MFFKVAQAPPCFLLGLCTISVSRRKKGGLRKKKGFVIYTIVISRGSSKYIFLKVAGFVGPDESQVEMATNLAISILNKPRY